MTVSIDLVVNAEPRRVTAAPGTPLLYVLRNDLGLTGTRFGCGLEQCASCTVLVDGEPVYACTRAIETLAGRSVETVEHGQADPLLGRLQAAFLERQAGQCGYCLSGVLMSARALLARRTEPSRREVVEALDRHLCRCGAQQRMVEAVLDVVRGRNRPVPASGVDRVELTASATTDEARALRGFRGFLEPGEETRAGPGLPAHPSDSSSLGQNPSLERWIRFLDTGVVRIATGKVEIGQGIVTALAQIAAEELSVPIERVAVLSGSSAEGPDERYTTSSLSIQESGAAVRMVCASVRERMLGRLSQRLNCARSELAIDSGRFTRAGRPTGFDYWSLASEVDLVSRIGEGIALKSPEDYTVVGSSIARIDLPAKVSGAAFLHDLGFEGMLHARVLRQPSRGAELDTLDEDRVRSAAGGALDIIRMGSFWACLGEDEAAVERAAAAAAQTAVWRGVAMVPADSAEAEWLVGQPAKERRLGPAAVAAGVVETVTGVYSRGYVAHASMGPSAAVARLGEGPDGRLEVWSHGQGMHPLRRTLAAALGVPEDRVVTRHADGAGCYGHNGADDAALDAALIARERPGRAVRVQWRREDEFGFEPVGPAMRVRLAVGVDGAGRPLDWSTEIWSGVHVQRPGLGGGNLLAAEALPDPAPAPDVSDPPEARGGGATRNAVPLYDLGPAGRHRIVHRLIPGVPVRTSALRGLGAVPNVFAIESMMDDLAERAGRDPVDYRLSLLSDPRARRVLEAVAELAGWSAPAPPRGSGAGRGIAFARYKNTAAYAAVAVEVRAEQEITVERVWCVADAGLVVNPDGASNQLEGGIVQGASWALREQVRFGPTGIASRDWDAYPIFRFSDVPRIDVALIDARAWPSLGVGECTVGPAAAAIGNAAARALGTRLRNMPFTRERVAAALLAG